MEAELKIPESRPQAGGTISGRHGQEPQAGCISPSTQCGTPDRTEEEGEEGGGGGGGAPVGRAGSDALALSACGNARVAGSSSSVLLYMCAFQPLRRLPHTRVTAFASHQISFSFGGFFVSLAQHLPRLSTNAIPSIDRKSVV